MTMVAETAASWATKGKMKCAPGTITEGKWFILYIIMVYMICYMELICIHSLSACTFPLLAIIYLKDYLYSCSIDKEGSYKVY